MIVLKNFSELKNTIAKIAVDAIQEQTQEFKNQLNSDLLNNQAADGTQAPSKKESTKKAYRPHGWDEEHWLVRTGNSTKFRMEKTTNGIQIRLPDWSDNPLKYHEYTEHWFQLSEDSKRRVVEALVQKLGRL